MKVKIVSSNHPRLNVGFIYNREEATGGVRYTSLGGKHSVFISFEHPFDVQCVDCGAAPEATRDFHTEPHIRIGERIAADLWREEYIDHAKYSTAEASAACADVAVESFLARWERGFFRGRG